MSIESANSVVIYNISVDMSIKRRNVSKSHTNGCVVDIMVLRNILLYRRSIW